MKHIYKLIFCMFFCSTQLLSFGQTWNWAKQSNGTTTTGYNSVADIVLDSDKNAYAVGQFDKPLNFGSVTLSPTLRNIFVAKFDSTGVCVWAKSAGSFNVSAAYSIAIDQNEDLIVCGAYNGLANFDSFTINSNGQSDIFIAKINSSGIWQWVKSYGNYSYDSGRQVATDLYNNIYLTGITVDTVTFDTCQVNGLGGYDAFVAKYTSSGQCVWVESTLGLGNEKGTCISVSSLGSIFIGGVYSGDPIVFGDTLNSIGQDDEYNFISKIDTSGNDIWTKQLSCGAMNNMSGLSSIAADNYDNVYFTGNFAYSCLLDTFSYSAPSTAVRNSYIGKLDSSSNVIWAKKGDGPTNNWGSSIFVDANNYCYVAGYYTDSLIYDCNSVSAGANGYIMKLDSLGGCICLDNVKNINPSSILVNMNNIWLTGYFMDTAVFGGTVLITSNNTEIFIANSTSCVDLATETEEHDWSKSSCLVYPNPFSENTTFVIQSDKLNEIYSFELTDVLGKKVKSKNRISEKQFEISRDGLENGIYFYKVYTSESVIGIGKVVIK